MDSPSFPSSAVIPHPQLIDLLMAFTYWWEIAPSVLIVALSGTVLECWSMGRSSFRVHQFSSSCCFGSYHGCLHQVSFMSSWVQHGVLERSWGLSIPQVKTQLHFQTRNVYAYPRRPEEWPRSLRPLHPDVVVCTWISSTWEAEAKGPRVHTQSGLRSETLCPWLQVLWLCGSFFAIGCGTWDLERNSYLKGVATVVCCALHFTTASCDSRWSSPQLL